MAGVSYRRAVNLAHGTKDLLDHFHIPRRSRRFCFAAVVGVGSNASDLYFQLVAGLPERPFLARDGSYFSFLTQMLRKLSGSLWSPWAWSLIGAVS
jgi:hypothetical protein